MTSGRVPDQARGSATLATYRVGGSWHKAADSDIHHELRPRRIGAKRTPWGTLPPRRAQLRVARRGRCERSGSRTYKENLCHNVLHAIVNHPTRSRALHVRGKEALELCPEQDDIPMGREEEPSPTGAPAPLWHGAQTIR